MQYNIINYNIIYKHTKYIEVALQPLLTFKGPLILQVMKLKSKILQKYIYKC